METGAITEGQRRRAPVRETEVQQGNSGGKGSELLVLYGSGGRSDQGVPRETWEEKHPDIKVNIVRDSTGIITARLLAEKANPQADLVWGTAATSLLVLDQNNMLEPYSPQGLEADPAGLQG